MSDDVVRPSEVRVALMRAPLTPAAKLAGIRIFDVQGRRLGVCMLSSKRLAEDCGLSVDSLKRGLRELTAAGWLVTDYPSPNRAHRRLVVPQTVGCADDRVTGALVRPYTPRGAPIHPLGVRPYTPRGVPMHPLIESVIESGSESVTESAPLPPAPRPLPAVARRVWADVCERPTSDGWRAVVDHDERDRPHFVAIAELAQRVAAAEDGEASAVLERWADQWAAAAEVRTASSWRSACAAYAAGRTWGRARKRTARAEPMAFDPESVAESARRVDEIFGPPTAEAAE